MNVWRLEVHSTRRADERATVETTHFSKRVTHLALRFRGQRGGRRSESVQLDPEQRRALAEELMAPDRVGWSQFDRRLAVVTEAAGLVGSLDGTVGRTGEQVAAQLRDVGDGAATVPVDRVALARLLEALQDAGVAGWWKQ